MKTIHSAFLALILISLLFARCKKDSDNMVPAEMETRISAYYVDNDLTFKFSYNELKKISKIEALDEHGVVADAATYEYDADGILKKKITGTGTDEYKRNDSGQIIQSTYTYKGGPATVGDLTEVKKNYTYNEAGRVKDIKSYNKDGIYIYQTRYDYFGNGSLKLIEKFRQAEVGPIAKRTSRMDFAEATPGNLILFEQLYRSLAEPIPYDLILMHLTDQLRVRQYETDGITVSNETKYEMSDRKYQEPDGFLESQQTQVSFIFPAKAPEIIKYKYEYIKL